MVLIEETKLGCNNCGREYYPKDIRNEEQGIYIDKFVPKDGHCFDCGSRDIVRSGNAADFEQKMSAYKQSKDDILGFYSEIGLLLDFELKSGYEDYADLKEQMQFNIKH